MRRADPSSREVVPIVCFCHCVCDRCNNDLLQLQLVGRRDQITKKGSSYCSANYICNHLKQTDNYVKHQL